MKVSRNLEKLSTGGKYLFLAYDHGFEHGPTDFNERSIDPTFILELALTGGYNAIVLHKGIAEKYWANSVYCKVPLILKLNGKTNLYKGEPYSPQICSVKYAKDLGASAVGYTIYIGSEHECKMTKEFGFIVEEAHAFGLPVVAWMYPRGKAIENDTAPDIIAYASRVGLEVGADMVKIKYSGSQESFSKAVMVAGKTKVILSGGPFVGDEEFLNIVKCVMAAGAAGVAVGRNVWQNENPLHMTQKLKEVIFSP